MAEAEFISAEHSNHFRGIRGALAPHGTGPTIMGPMISKMFIAAQGSFLYFHAVVELEQSLGDTVTHGIPSTILIGNGINDTIRIHLASKGKYFLTC